MRYSTIPGMAVTVVLLSGTAIAQADSPYVGEEERTIAALSESDIAGLLAGQGMGYGKTGELNGYPGPRHVLDLAEELALSDRQRAETQAIFERMQHAAKKLGAELVAAERELDRMFSDADIDESGLSDKLMVIGGLESRLRGVHLSAHLAQRDILNEQQLASYTVLRGYGGSGHGGESHPHP